MKILLTGASGLVGAAVSRYAANAGHQVTAIVSRWSGNVPGATETRRAELRDPATVRALVQTTAPNVIINAAAVAEPAQCDADPVRAHELNVALPLTLAAVAAQVDARLLHLSSEQVFDGESGPYSVAHTPKPINLYGRQKVESELGVLAAAPASAVVRLPLLLGNSLSGRRSVHEKMFEIWAAGQPVKLYRDEVRQVCSAESVAAMLVELGTRADLRGIFHWAGTEPVTRWELGLKIAAHFGAGADQLVPMQRSDTPAVSAKRPRDLALNLAPLERELKTRPESADEAVRGLEKPAWVTG